MMVSCPDQTTRGLVPDHSRSVQNNSWSSVNFRPFHGNDRANCCLVGLTVQSYPCLCKHIVQTWLQQQTGLLWPREFNPEHLYSFPQPKEYIQTKLRIVQPKFSLVCQMTYHNLNLILYTALVWSGHETN